MEIVLATSSPRRKELMNRLAESFRIVPVDVDESSVAESDPERFAMRAAALKAETAAATHPDAIVIGADTVVTVEGRLLGKPADREDAKAMLELLSGRTHLVITGIALWHKSSNRSLVDREVTAVTFRPLSVAMIDAYLDRGDFLDKAGAYAIQDVGKAFVSAIDGDYDNVVGFPISRVGEMLTQMLRDLPRLTV
jgi:septum formation protein